jgi:hypothetical protein
MNMEDVVLNEISQAQKDKNCMILLICGCNLRKVKLTEVESKRIPLARRGTWMEKERY